MPSKLSVVPGIFAVTDAVAAFCTTGSVTSRCECEIRGFSFASRSGFLMIGNCFMSRRGSDLSL